MSYAAYVWIAYQFVQFCALVKKDNSWSGIVAAAISIALINGVLYWGDFYKIQ